MDMVQRFEMIVVSPVLVDFQEEERQDPCVDILSEDPVGSSISSIFPQKCYFKVKKSRKNVFFSNNYAKRSSFYRG